MDCNTQSKRSTLSAESEDCTFAATLNKRASEQNLRILNWVVYLEKKISEEKNEFEQQQNKDDLNVGSDSRLAFYLDFHSINKFIGQHQIYSASESGKRKQQEAVRESVSIACLNNRFSCSGSRTARSSCVLACPVSATQLDAPRRCAQ